MNKVINKKGISLIALIITIIVLMGLTATVVITGKNTPKNTEYAIKMHNYAAVQDAVTIYIMNTMLEGTGEQTVEEIVGELYNVASKEWVDNASTKLGINLTQEELQAVFTLDSKGVVSWVAGQEPTLETDENNNQQQPTKTLSSIAITTLPTKTEYTVGETVDMTGLVVTATYSDNSTANVTSSVTYTPTLTEITASAGTKEITVTYEEKVAPEKITLTVTEATKTLSSIAITTLPTKTEYTVGETVDMTGLVVTATYSDNSTENVTSSVTYTPALTEITASAGTKEITVTYGEKAAPEKITLTVTEATQQATLGSIITPDDYGKSIDYTVTVDGYEYTDWVVLYEDAANDRVFILKEDNMYFDEGAEATCEYDEEYAKIFKLGQVGHVHSSNMECRSAKRMISDYSNWFNSQEYDGEGRMSYSLCKLYQTFYDIKQILYFKKYSVCFFC